MTMHKALHPKGNVDRIYLSRKEGGRGLISIEDTTRTAILGRQKYIQESEEKQGNQKIYQKQQRDSKVEKQRNVKKTGPTKRYMDSF